MKKLLVLLWLLVLPALAAANASQYWTEDHPFMYHARYTRMPDGTIQRSNDTMSWTTFKGNLTQQLPGYIKWYFSKAGQKTAKDIEKLVLYNFLTPMDYGRSLRANRARTVRNIAFKTFMLDNMALPVVKKVAQALWNSIKVHYMGYVERQKFYARIATMTSAELAAEFNLTLPPYDPEADKLLARSNKTLPYVWKGAMYTDNQDLAEHFEPYPGYVKQYYAEDNDLPAPSLPTELYPWPWNARLAVTRAIVLRTMQYYADNEANATMNGTQGSDTNPSLLLRTLAEVGDLDSSNESDHDDDLEGQDSDFMKQYAMQEMEMYLTEFHFATGIPRITMQNSTHVAFPSLASFLNGTIFETNRTISSVDVPTFSPLSQSSESPSDGWWTSSGSASGSHETSTSSPVVNETRVKQDDIGRLRKHFSSREGVYTALKQFYAYPSTSPTLVLHDSTDNSSTTVRCSLETNCLVQSSVTVYTPALESLEFFSNVVQNASMTVEDRRQARRNALQDMIATAFEFEQLALAAGLRAPSTVWYSHFDRETDEFADALVGYVNATAKQKHSADFSPLVVFESLTIDAASPFYSTISYYTDTIHAILRALKTDQHIQSLQTFEQSELLQLIAFITSKIQRLEETIASFVVTREADVLYQAAVNATLSGALYDGQEYTTLGFGYVLPATNDMNVNYLDMKLPVPLHLVLRVIVRFQESELLLPDESRHVLACLAMLRNNISFYRCQ